MQRLHRGIGTCAGLVCVSWLAAAIAWGQTAPAKPGAEAEKSAPAHAAAGAKAATTAGLPTIRINAGVDQPLTDSQGVEWLADTGFDEGTPNDRADLRVTGTETPEIYRSERYSMNFYNVKVPNGNYTLKLHFSEDYEGINDPSERIFTYAVKDGDPKTGKTIKEVKDFSPWKAAGAQYKAYIDNVPVNVTNGQITITFTPQVENPQINAIEIVPK
jgi:malectin (di-glucose binding ER protein)